jgi:capsular exopolysaccharide synthesis family protein
MVQPVKSLLITSAAPAEGKSTTAANLAVSVAQLGWRVLLVDTDLRRPVQHRAFGLARDKGLTDILVHGVDWHEILHETSLETLKILPAGMTPPNPVDLLSTRRMKVLITQITRAFDLVIFDTPMVLSLPEVTILAPLMDGVLLVHSPRRTNRDVVLQAKQMLARRGAPLLGVVLNNISDKAIPYYTSYSYAAYYTPPMRGSRLDNGAIGKPIDMQPEENGDNWAPRPLAMHHSAAGIQRTARSGDLTLSILAVSLQQRLAEVESDAGWQFLVLDVEIANNAMFPYTFHAAQTAIAVNPQSVYSQALASLIELPSRSAATVPFLQGQQVYQYDPRLTQQLADGLVSTATISSQGVQRGFLVYQVPLHADSYVFVYENEDGSCTIPLGKG